MSLSHSQSTAEEVSNFYSSIRDYWANLSTSVSGTPSCMLNFGCWDAQAPDLFTAQAQFCQHLLDFVPHGRQPLSGLEIGCGIGGISLEMLRALPGLQMSALDISIQQLAVATANALVAGLSDRVTWHEGSSMAIPAVEASYDFTLCVESSFHYDDKPKFFSENLRVLKPGGIAVVADITCSDVERIKLRRGNHFEGNAAYLKLIREAGFELREMRSIGKDVYRPLYEFVLQFNDHHRSPVGKYWATVLRNYATLADEGLMDYCIFVMKKPTTRRFS